MRVPDPALQSTTSRLFKSGETGLSSKTHFHLSPTGNYDTYEAKDFFKPSKSDVGNTIVLREGVLDRLNFLRSRPGEPTPQNRLEMTS